MGDLTGLPTANSSLLDEGTAAAEAMTLVRRANKKATGPFVVDADALPQTIEVVCTRAAAMGIEVTVADLADGLPEGELCGCCMLPRRLRPDPDPPPVIEAAHERNALAVVAADLLALALLKSPGQRADDVVVGSSQRFGVPLFYGGPQPGSWPSPRAQRHLPGRLVGVSVDAEGRPAYRLALQTREQHIRRDKATSNICTAQVLLAVVASMYAVYHGPEGIRAIATRAHRYAAVLARALTDAGIEVEHREFFDTLTVAVPGRGDEVVAAARSLGLHLRLVDADRVGLSTSETTHPLDAHRAAAGVRRGTGDTDLDSIDQQVADACPTRCRAATTTSPTRVLRAPQRDPDAALPAPLSARDYALDRGMIPLGSCTMSSTPPPRWAGQPARFADLTRSRRPRTPQATRLIGDLEGWLAEVTGYDHVSIQPNAGSQGELAGLLAIRGYHHANGDTSARSA